MRFFINILVTCLRFWSSVFLVYYEHVFVYYDVFIFTISFLMFLLSILNRFHALIYFFSVISFKHVLSPEAATRGVLQKRYSLKLRNIYRKLPVLEALFNKVAGLQSRTKYLTKVEKCSKIGQEKKSLISAFVCFLLPKFNFWKGDWTLGYVFTQIWDFSIIS